MGKGSGPTIGYWYHLAAHFIITPRKVNGFLEMRGGTKTAWTGTVTESSTVYVDAPKLWGGEKDQGGIQTDMQFMFGDDDQLPNPYLVGVFGDQTAAWRGWTGVSLNGGRYGAMNPYAQKPSWKFWRTTKGWDDDECWYQTKAEVTMIDGFVTLLGTGWEYVVENFSEPNSGWNNFTVPTSGWALGGELPWHTGTSPEWPLMRSNIWLRRQMNVTAVGITLNIGADNGCVVWVDGVQVGTSNPTNADIPSNQLNPVSFAFNAIGTVEVVVKAFAEVLASDDSGNIVDLSFTGTPLIAANPAHVLYETLTAADMGREPVERINDASFRAAADKLYAEGFGICPFWDSGKEPLDTFRARICKLIAGSLNRSVEDGQWYLDLARGDYVLEDLPILTDDDILEFKEQVSTLDNAINSVSVKWTDSANKAQKTTSAVRAMGLIRQFGTIHQLYEYPEIPTEPLALRVGQRDLMATTTPTRAFDCVWKPTVYALRPNQYFRLQAPKRGIADMVCIVGEKQHGTLKSGAIRMKAVQDIYSMPSTSFSQGEPGVDTRPQQTPKAITLQRADEAPYLELAAAMTRADLEALPADAGFAMAVAAAPASELDFTMMVDTGAGYEEASRGEWAATATVNEAADKDDTSFTLAAGKRLDQVVVGMPAWWDDELVRVGAIDAGAGTITLARACGDTVPAAHAANARLWFYRVGFAYDTTEYTDGETIAVKLLPNTGSQQLPIGSAAPMSIELNGRQVRPYPPGKVRIDGSAWPAAVTGAFDVTWAHRDRIAQADQLLDFEAASVGPEPTARYALQLYDDDTDTLLVEKLDLGGTVAHCDLAADANVRLVLWTISDLGESWQKHEHVFAFTAAAGTDAITGDSYEPPTWVIDGNGG